MKKTTLLFFVFILTLNTFGQTVKSDTTKKEFKNIIAINVSPLLRQFFNNTTYNYYYYNYFPIAISYRRIFKSNAIKLSIGADLNTGNQTTNDTLGTSNARNNYNVRVGYEHYMYLGKRWHWYIGADLIGGYAFNKYKNSYDANSYTEDKSKEYYLGAAPVLGIVFNITNRMSISSESWYDVAYRFKTSEQTRFPDTSENRTTKTNYLSSQFVGPELINFRIKF